MLEFEDIQHILLTRTPAITGRYEFLSFDTSAGGRAWLSELLDKTESVADATAAMDSSDRWVTLAFTWNGLRALGVPEESLQTFPEEFRTGMAARADILGDIGANAPEHWVGGLAGDDLHAIAILFSRTDEQCRRSIEEHDKLLARNRRGAQSFVPRPQCDTAVQLRPRSFRLPGQGSGATLEPGEFILGYPDENGPVPNLPEPEVLSRNGSYMAYRRLQEHVTLFRDYLLENAETPEEQELLAAKFMGRSRSGAPLVLAPDKDDPVLGADPMRNNDFNYEEMDPFGYACPLGAHARRLNPRDTAHYMNRRRMIRRGATYGPALPEGAPDEGWTAASPRSSSAPICCVSSSSRRTCGSTTRNSTSSTTNTTRSLAPRTARWISQFRKGRSARCTRAFRRSRVHHPVGRGVLLPPRYERDALPVLARQLKDRP